MYSGEMSRARDRDSVSWGGTYPPHPHHEDRSQRAKRCWNALALVVVIMVAATRPVSTAAASFDLVDI